MKNDNAHQFTDVNSYEKGKVPLCYNHNQQEQKCCTIKDGDFHLGCPQFCFEDVQSQIDNIKDTDEEKFKTILNTNNYCNSF